MRRLILEFEEDDAAEGVAVVFRQMTLEPGTSPRPMPVAVMEIFTGRTVVRLIEPPDVDFTLFGLVDATLCGALARRGWDSVRALETISDEWDQRLRPWEILLGLPNVGPRRVLSLVNWLRDGGAELSWFASWDTGSANWTALEGCRRADPAGNP